MSAGRSICCAAFWPSPMMPRRAWAKLLELCAQMRADRSATNFNGLVRVLRQAGIALNAPPDYRADIAALKSWTGRSLGAAPRFLQLLASRPDTRVARDVWPTVRAAADQGSFLIVGDPGSGKSGLAYTLGLDRQQEAKDLVFLPVDTLKADFSRRCAQPSGLPMTLPMFSPIGRGQATRCLLLTPSMPPAMGRPETYCGR